MLDGKGNGVLRDKVSQLEEAVADLTQREKAARLAERNSLRRQEEQKTKQEAYKSEMRQRNEAERKRH